MFGGVRSEVHDTVRDMVDVLPHPSISVNVLVCEEVQLLFVTVPSLCEIVGAPHASVAVAEPSAVFIAVDVGLQPSVTRL